MDIITRQKKNLPFAQERREDQSIQEAAPM